MAPAERILDLEPSPLFVLRSVEEGVKRQRPHVVLTLRNFDCGGAVAEVKAHFHDLGAWYIAIHHRRDGHLPATEVVDPRGDREPLSG